MHEISLSNTNKISFVCLLLINDPLCVDPLPVSSPGLSDIFLYKCFHSVYPGKHKTLTIAYAIVATRRRRPGLCFRDAKPSAKLPALRHSSRDDMTEFIITPEMYNSSTKFNKKIPVFAFVFRQLCLYVYVYACTCVCLSAENFINENDDDAMLYL